MISPFVTKECVIHREQQLPHYPYDMTVSEIFSWQAVRHADRPAILDGDDCLTYAELERLSNQVARELATEGAGEGDTICTVTMRSTETLVLWLAILKLGCVYLPIDPGYPGAAIALMIVDARPRLIIAESMQAADGIAPGDCRVLEIGSIVAAALAGNSDPLPCHVNATSPAYIMFTSGSTGRPKGVVVSHRAIVRLVRDQSYVDFGETAVFLQMSALAFDACTFEIWGALLNGGSIGIIAGERISIPQIGEAIARYGVNTVFMTTALFNAIVDLDIDVLAGLRQVMVGGDVVSPKHLLAAMEKFPEAKFINGYGPTEATTFSLCYRLERGGWGAGQIPIGSPLNHTHAYILDADMNRCADGGPGELWIGGDGVAIGYLNRPELTADRFRPDPFATHSSARMYGTGDLARVRQDGHIEFLGRNDRQIKIDGKRIELDEIEHALRLSPAVADAVISVRVLGSVDKQIVAFVKLAKNVHANHSVAMIIDELRNRLPRHMIPARTVAVADFPLTENGKINKSALMQLLVT